MIEVEVSIKVGDKTPYSSRTHLTRKKLLECLRKEELEDFGPMVAKAEIQSAIKERMERVLEIMDKRHEFDQFKRTE